MLLITKAVPEILRARAMGYENVGRLVQPRHYSSMARLVAAGIPWAADNDAFQGFKPGPWLRMLGDLAANPAGCLFVVAPDVVADAVATMRLFLRYQPVIRDCGLPVAYVLQDGLEGVGVPWAMLDAVFVGGSTPFKLGDVAHRTIQEAKDRGKWVHMGRVNSQRRMMYAASIGVDSVDGTKYAAFFDRWLKEGATWAGTGQTAIWEGVR